LNAAIRVNNSAVDIDGMEIAGVLNGVEISGTGSPVLSGNAIHDCTGTGIYIDAPATPWLIHNTLQRTRGAGVSARPGSKPALVGNLFEKSALDLPPDIPLDTVKARNFLLDAKPAPRPSTPNPAVLHPPAPLHLGGKQ